jgi:CheY-like chemotaxis protein
MPTVPPADVAAELARALTTPLNGLLAVAELLQRQPLSETARAQVQVMLDAGRRMTTMLCDAIETDPAAAPPSPIPTALRELVDDVENRWRSGTHEDGGRLLISCNAPADLRLMLDPVRVRRLLNTLIEDALKVTAWGVLELQLGVEATADGRIGVKGALDAPGASLLGCDAVAFRLCRSIVQEMGGDLTRTQNDGSGVRTEFTVKVDQAGADMAEVGESEAAEGPLPPRTHLLIVDDNATNRIVAAALCEMFGCTSETAEDGLEAVEAVQSRPFDLILMDIKMPRMDGLEATRTIRALNGPGAATPIVALTANADAAAAASYLAVGMQGVVDKPIKPAQLLSMMQSVLWRQGEVPAAHSSAA